MKERLKSILNPQKIGIAGAIFLLGFLFASLLGNSLKEKCTTNHRFINPQIDCLPAPVISKSNYLDLENKVVTYIESQKDKNAVTDVSVYFRDLHQGPVMDINEDKEYIPASLLKLPLLLTYYQIAETKPEILNEEIPYRENIELGTTFYKPEVVLDEGRLYSIQTYLDQMIIYSDNYATLLLRQYLNEYYPSENLFTQTLYDLAIIPPKSNFDELVSVRSFSSIFRLLFNASFLGPEYSEKALALLSKSTFKKGLVKGLPENIIVAHKFGERTPREGEKELHDCGIVYFPDNPYSLCVMTEGSDIAKLEETIQTISSMVYKEVQSRKL